MRPAARSTRKSYKRGRLAAAVEIGLWVAGGLARAFWIAARGHASWQGERDLARFERALEAAAAAPMAFAPAVEEPEPAAPLVRPLPLAGDPDRSRWSATRAQAYDHARTASNAAPLAVLEIDAIGLRVALLDGVDPLTLNRGVGRIPRTAAPGEAGNLGIAGHRDGFFRDLGVLARGDELVLHTLRGPERYRVSWTRVVEPEDVDVLAPTSPPSVTLVTCFPFHYVGNAPQRYVVRAERVVPEPQA